MRCIFPLSFTPSLSLLSLLSGAFNATHGSYFGDSGLPTVMAYTDCFGQESQFSNCTGFRYDPYIPQWYCSDNTIAGAQCIGEFTRDYC